MYINRLVTALTPLVFAPLAGFITAYAAQHLPGLPPLDSTQITALFVTGATIAFGKAAMWMRGWHLFMQSPDGQVGAPEDDDVILDRAGGPVIDQLPTGGYDQHSDFDAQPHIDGNGHGVLVS